MWLPVLFRGMLCCELLLQLADNERGSAYFWLLGVYFPSRAVVDPMNNQFTLFNQESYSG